MKSSWMTWRKRNLIWVLAAWIWQTALCSDSLIFNIWRLVKKISNLQPCKSKWACLLSHPHIHQRKWSQIMVSTTCPRTSLQSTTAGLSSSNTSWTNLTSTNTPLPWPNFSQPNTVTSSPIMTKTTPSLSPRAPQPAFSKPSCSNPRTWSMCIPWIPNVWRSSCPRNGLPLTQSLFSILMLNLKMIWWRMQNSRRCWGSKCKTWSKSKSL